MRWNHLAALKLKAFLGARSEPRAYPVICGQERLSFFSPWHSKFHLSFQALSRPYRFPVTQVSLGFSSYDVWYRFHSHAWLPQKPLKGISSPSIARTIWLASFLVRPRASSSQTLSFPPVSVSLAFAHVWGFPLWPPGLICSCFLVLVAALSQINALLAQWLLVWESIALTPD